MATKRVCDRCGAEINPFNSVTYAGMRRVNHSRPLALAYLALTEEVDSVPVVRCKDCKHYDMGVCLKIYSDGNVHPEAWQSRKPEDFCSYGERNQNQ